MKKLLSLLSVLTISGATMPMVVAAGPYQQKNNLETLKRNKRENNNKTPEVKVSYEINDYFSDLYNTITFLQNNGNVRLISPQITGGHSAPNVFYLNQSPNNEYFIMPINIEDDRRISLIFRSNDFYLQGFIGHPTSNNQTLNVYYYFNDATIRNVSGTTSSRIIPFGSNYTGSNGLQANQQAPIRWTGIIDSFHQLANYGEQPSNEPSNVDSNTLRAAFLRVILATSEALRFTTVRNTIISNHNSDTSTSNWGWYFDNFLRNWDRISQEALNHLIQLGTLVGFSALNNVNIFSKTLSNSFQACDRRQGRDLNNNDNNEYCPILNKIYFNSEHKDEIFQNDWETNKTNKFYKLYTLNVGQIDPLSYNKINFIGDNLYTKASHGNDAYYGKSIKDYFNERNNKFDDIIKKVEENSNIDNHLNYINLQNQEVGRGSGFLQYFSLHYYKKNNSNDYCLCIELFQTVTNASVFGQAGAIWNNIGNGIILFNDKKTNKLIE